MAPIYIGTVPKNRDPLEAIHAEHFIGFRFMLVDSHVFIISCPNGPHGDAVSKVNAQLDRYADSVVPEMCTISGAWSSATNQADVSMSRKYDPLLPPLIPGRSARQPVLVVEVVCSSPTSLFRALDQADNHMANNVETAAYIIFYFFKVRRDNTLAMVAIDVGRGVGGAAEIQQFISFGTATPIFARPHHALHDAFVGVVQHVAPVAAGPMLPGENHNFHGAAGVATTLTIDGARLHRPGVHLVIVVSRVASAYYNQLY